MWGTEPSESLYPDLNFPRRMDGSQLHKMIFENINSRGTITRVHFQILGLSKGPLLSPCETGYKSWGTFLEAR